MNNENESITIEQIQSEAEAGNSLAIKIYARHLQESDINKSLYYYIQSAQDHELDSINFLVKYYQNTNQLDFYIFYLQMAADLHDSNAIISLAHHYQNILNPTDDLCISNIEDETFNYFIKYTMLASEDGDPQSVIILAHAYLNGLWGFEKDPSRSLNLYLHGNNPSCLINAAKLLYSGDFKISQNKLEALDLLIKSAKTFGEPTLKSVADLLISENTNDSFENALELYRESADVAGNLDAAKSLGDCYSFSLGPLYDSSQAIYYYEKAVDGGNMDAVPSLVRLLWKGKFKDQAYALELYKKWIQTQSADVKKEFEKMTERDWMDCMDRIFEN